MIETLTKEISLHDGIKILRLEVVPPLVPAQNVVGIDPGTAHLGIAVLQQPNIYEYAILYEITLKRSASQLERLLQVQHLIEDLAREDYWFYDPATVIIEGASFADRFRQAELAEQRAAIALHAAEYNTTIPDFVPPMKILKKVFGSAKLPAWKLWPELPRNAASALACALYPLVSAPVEIEREEIAS